MILELFSAYLVNNATATMCRQITAKVISFDESSVVTQARDGRRAVFKLEKLPEQMRRSFQAQVGHEVTACVPIEAEVTVLRAKSKK